MENVTITKKQWKEVVKAVENKMMTDENLKDMPPMMKLTMIAAGGVFANKMQQIIFEEQEDQPEE